MHYWTPEGRQILDGAAGLWCVNAGHGRREITQAVASSLETLDFAPTFQMAHPPAFRLANELAKIAPSGLDHVFFTNSGSESVDTALNIALAYHRVRGEASRTRQIGRERGYHGVGFGGTSVGGISPNRKIWSATLLPGVDHLPHTHDLAKNAFSRGEPAHGERTWPASWNGWSRCTISLNNCRRSSSSRSPAPAGVLVPPRGYLESGIREIC